ncbi:MAG: replication initiation protein [Bacteroidetes bacterium]|nr:replication initiation protein [Bacteroidota bacterium]
MEEQVKDSKPEEKAPKKKVSRHPSLYTIYKPNELIKAKKLNLNFTELRVYNEILNNNHVAEPDKVIYQVPYHYAFDVADTKNRAANIRRISENLQKRVFYFNEEFMMEHFGKKVDASMNPFPEVNYYEDHFEIHLWPRFKKILTMIELGFTKGDIETLRSFEHEVSNTLYWIIRQKQVWKSEWEVELEALKEALGLADKYPSFGNFKRRVLDVAYEELKGTYTEFTYELVKKGRGGAVSAIRFRFKNGPKEELDAPAGKGFQWEEKLLTWGVLPDKVKEIRHRVRVGQENLEPVFVWDSDYVRFSIEGAQRELDEKKKDPKKSKVQNPGGWVYNGLIVGQWLNYVTWRKNKIVNETQKKLEFIDYAPADVVATEPPQGTPVTPAELKDVFEKPLGGPVRKRVVASEVDWKPLWEETKYNEKMTYEEFLQLSGYQQEGREWVRYH